MAYWQLVAADIPPGVAVQRREGAAVAASVLRRNNVHVSGSSAPGARAMVFAHGYGCDQHMWRFVAPAFEGEYRVVLFDHVGAGQSDLGAYDRVKYSTLQGYADDVLELCAALEIRHGVFVGHSVSAMIGVLAAIAEPERFDQLVLVGPSPRYIDDTSGGYVGGFSEGDIRELLDYQESNYLGWASSLGPVIMGNADQPALAEELTNSFCRTDPEIARQFAAVTFLSDNREDLGRVRVPALILQCAEDAIAPPAVGEYVHARMPESELALLRATGHCPHLSAPEETIAAMRGFLGS